MALQFTAHIRRSILLGMESINNSRRIFAKSALVFETGSFVFSTKESPCFEHRSRLIRLFPSSLGGAHLLHGPGRRGSCRAADAHLHPHDAGRSAGLCRLPRGPESFEPASGGRLAQLVRTAAAHAAASMIFVLAALVQGESEDASSVDQVHIFWRGIAKSDRYA